MTAGGSERSALPVSHVLALKTPPGSTGYTALQRACKAIQKAGFPLLFDGRLLRAGNLVVWAAIACRVGGLEDPVDLLQQVLGCGTVRMIEEILADGANG